MPTRQIAETEIRTLRGQTIVVDLDPGFSEIPSVANRLRAAAEQHAVTFTFRYMDPSQAKADDFAIFSTFKGNQKDAIGSWNFLFSPEQGPLAMFGDEVRGLMQKAADAQDEDQRTNILQELHRQVLDQAYGVPFWMEASAILASNRIGLSNVNRFDLRLRFYDVVWK